MAKGLRSNVKKALRTIRKHEVKTSSIHRKREEEKFARLQVAVEKGVEYRQMAEGSRLEEAEKAMSQDSTPVEKPSEILNTDNMDIDTAAGKGKHGANLLPKKKMHKRKGLPSGKNHFHKRKGKSRRKK